MKLVRPPTQFCRQTECHSRCLSSAHRSNPSDPSDPSTRPHPSAPDRTRPHSSALIHLVHTRPARLRPFAFVHPHPPIRRTPASAAGGWAVSSRSARWRLVT
eukprot:1189784-Prymnesium_polylepis.1